MNSRTKQTQYKSNQLKSSSAVPRFSHKRHQVRNVQLKKTSKYKTKHRINATFTESESVSSHAKQTHERRIL